MQIINQLKSDVDRIQAKFDSQLEQVQNFRVQMHEKELHYMQKLKGAYQVIQDLNHQKLSNTTKSGEFKLDESHT